MMVTPEFYNLVVDLIYIIQTYGIFVGYIGIAIMIILLLLESLRITRGKNG